MAHADTKTVGAAALALAALAVGGWQATRYLTSPDEVRSAEQVAREARRGGEAASPAEGGDGSAERELRAGGAGGPGDGPGGPGGGWAQRDPLGDDTAREFAFDSADSPTAAATALVSASDAMSLALDNEPQLAVLGTPAKLSLVESWRTLVSPLVAQERDRFRSAVTRLGGIAGETGAGGVFDRLSPLLAGASLDLSSAVTRAVDPAAPGIVPRMPVGIPGMPERQAPRRAGEGPSVPMMMMVNENTGPDGVERRETTLDLPMQELFPAAAQRAAAGARTIEVWAPTRMTGRKSRTADLGLSVFMVWDQKAQAWQPVAMRLRLLSEASTTALQDALRAARAARQETPQDTEITEDRP